MVSFKKNQYKINALILLVGLSTFSHTLCEKKDKKIKKETVKKSSNKKIINDIIVSGNTMVPKSAILNRIPYKIGQEFDPRKTKQLINNLYYDLKRFKNIQVEGKNVGKNKINIYIIVEEKIPLIAVKFVGNKHMNEKEIRKKLDFDSIPALNKEELATYAYKIKKLYQGKNYHHAEVAYQLDLNKDKKGTATFTIKENRKSLVKKILFIGNKNIKSKHLRKIIFTREDWILGLLDGSGNFHPERLEGDKHIIEQHYQNNGYLTAKVVDVDVEKDPKTKQFTITFEIKEGDKYTVKSVSSSGKNILRDEYIKAMLPLQAGQNYSREKIMDSIKALEFLWGELGYIFAHINPSIQPDEKDKTVTVSFETELGNKIFLNKINIIGNKKTRDKVIRRRLLLSEGSLITNQRMDLSKTRVESLGYFDQRDGVTWKTVRLDDEHANLDLILKEVKTGKANLKVGFGGSAVSQSGGSGFSFGGEIADTNLMGTGIQLMLSGSLAKEEKNLIFNITNPWMFDMPLSGAFDVYHKRLGYDEFKNTQPVNEKLTGAGGSLGFVTPLLYETQVMLRAGIDSVKYEIPPISKVRRSFLKNITEEINANTEYQSVLDRLFNPGTYGWIATHLAMDRKNHPMHPSRGYKWQAIYHVGLPSFSSNIGYHKFDLDVNWFTPLIGERDLVLKLHGYFGMVAPFKNRNIPYRELFHIGGPASVRGFLFGKIGPQFLGDSIGGKKGFFVNAELIFPITPDFTMKGVVFYDGGSGWDNPYASSISKTFLQHNSFKYRHAVGVGLRLLQPMPVKIDWGFKLDYNNKIKESSNEVHFSMSYDF